MEELNYDKYGRIKYTPSFHSKHMTSWNDEDLDYLINWYDVAGPRELSFALERPEASITEKYHRLKKKGRIN
ncbi:hypothetical protein [Clostridium sp.]|uniref:hypothetical protein n=1 Tax=Clostridium sp. TaxID=1506 RepID=UPI002FC74218